MVITSIPTPTVTVIPVPKPRRLLSSDAPVPPPRKSLLKSKSVERECNEEVRLRKNSELIRRDTHQPIFIEREKLQRILEVAEPELRSSKLRPCSFPSCSSSCHLNNLETSSFDKAENHLKSFCTPDDTPTMSARAIARNRGATTTTNYSNINNSERPLSAYEESAEATRQRKNRRASVAVMPMMELDYRDRVIAGSTRSATMGRRRSEGTAGREFSPDFGAIRVQVEDITSVPGSMMKEDDDEKSGEIDGGRSFDNGGETSTETITDATLNGSMLNGIRRVSDWAVPSEYASSPIAQELSQSEVEERPRPPIPAMYMNTSISSAATTTTDRGEESVYSDFVLKRNSSTSSMSGKSVTLLEQIIRTHAVWYLPHMGRPEVLHLLRRMEPGNFIVRASTRENCMALSVRLAPGAHVDIDHYIIEKLIVPLKSGSSKDSVAPTSVKAVRLEGSPLTFRSLPLLIEHYCVNEDELEHHLQLPSAIRACTTTKQLLSIAVMEQEFWAREMSLSRNKTASTSSSSRNSIASSFRSNNNINASNNNTMPRCHEAPDASTWFMDRPTVDDESIYDEVEPRMNSRTGVGGGGGSYYAVNDNIIKSNTLNNNSPRRSSGMLLTPEMALGPDQQKTSKKRRSSSRASSSSNPRFATVCVGDFTSLDNWNGTSSKNDPDETDSGLSTHSPPSKHDRLDDVHISRSDRRSQSVRSHKSVTSSPKLGIPSSTSSTLSRPRSFLRSLLSFGSSNKEQKRKESLDVDSTPRLANCEYFTPWDSNRSNMQQVRTSRSAFDITSPPTRGFFGSTTPKKRNGVMPSSVYQAKNASSSNMFDDENYTRGWKEAAYAETPNNHQADSSMRTFKPPNYDDVAGSSTGSPSSRSRPLAMRRERSDLGVMSNGFNLGVKNNAPRLAHHNESSPGPAHSSSNGRVPMTPPANAGDPLVQQNCVEELRRKRLQSANEMLSPHEINAAKHPYGEVHSAHASPQVSMRRRNGGFPSPSASHNGFNRNNAFAAIDRSRGGDHRLSVPNLIAVTDPLVPGSVGQSAKALRERLGGRTTDGELMVINEGLVTPVVRRKTFAPAMKTVTTSMDELGGEVMKKREALEAALNEKRRHPSDSMSSGSSDHSSLGRRKTSTSSPTTAQTSTESELVWRRAKHNAPPPSTTSKSSAPHQWSAVNHELKNRQQKIAKVLPTPQPRGHHNRNMSIVGGVGPAMMSECRRSSDYAQLCDFASEKHGVHLDVHSKIEDDAVSVAGTVFNEPWDSNVWENLLDLAHHGDESTMGLKVSEPIQEEDSDSDRTAGGDSTCQMDSDEDDDDDVEDEVIRWQTEKMMRRPLPSDRVTVKGWEQDADAGSSKFSTLESRSKNGSIAGSTLRRQPEGSFSIRSLPRALSRFSQSIGMNGMSAAASFGSIDDLPTTLPSMSPLLSGRISRAQLPRSASTDEKIGRAVQEYVEELAEVKEGDNACFGLTLRQFIACTKDTKETDPAVVIRNVRQFINGMKNYLVKHGEGDLHRIIDEESARLNSNQILNIDAVLEAVLHKLLLREVKPLLYHVMIKEHSKAGALQLISQNQGVVRKMNLTELGFTNPESLVTPAPSILEQVKLLMRKMQNHYSPMKKLENLMKAVGLVLGCQNNGNENENPTDPMSCGHRGLPPGDDLVRWFVYILARTSTVGCEVEAWYMWELLPQPVVTQSDASYYLTSLWSAVHVLKSAEAIRRLCENDQRVLMSLDSSRHCCSSPLLSTATLTRGTSAGLVQMISAATCDAFVKIAIPDEAIGCVRYATFPGVPMLTTSKLSRLVAHQQGITNPEEHGLYLIAEGFESCLLPTDCPVLVHEQLKKENKPHMFAYKRHEAKIAWPRAAIC